MLSNDKTFKASGVQEKPRLSIHRVTRNTMLPVSLWTGHFCKATCQNRIKIAVLNSKLVIRLLVGSWYCFGAKGALLLLFFVVL